MRYLSLLLCFSLFLVKVTTGYAQQTQGKVDNYGQEVWLGEVSVSTTKHGSGLGLGIRFNPIRHASRYTKRNYRASEFELTGRIGFSNYDFTRMMCLVTSEDTLALLSGSQFYLGTDHREANLILVERGEVLVGTSVSVGGRFRFKSSLSFGGRLLSVTSQVDRGLTSEAEARRAFLGCGAHIPGPPTRSGPQRLEQGVEFQSSSFSAIAEFGVGAEAILKRGWRFSIGILSRHYWYGDANFQVLDTRALEDRAALLALRDKAPLSAYRLQAALAVPLQIK